MRVFLCELRVNSEEFVRMEWRVFRKNEGLCGGRRRLDLGDDE